MEVKPTYFPSVPRIFEKIYTLATVERARTRQQLEQAVAAGLRRCARCRPPASRSRPELQAAFDAGRRRRCSRTSAPSSAASIKQAVTGAAPIAPEILEFFFACGVPVLEGYGMTETSTAATINTIETLPHRLGRSRRCRAVEIKIADDGEILIRGAEHLPRLLQERRGDHGDDRRRLAAHRRPRLASTRTATSTSPAARRTSSSPRAARTSRPPTWRTRLKQNRWISQAVDVRRPASVPDGAGHARPRGDRSLGAAARASRTTDIASSWRRTRRCAS